MTPMIPMTAFFDHGVPFAEGLFELAEGEPRLVGARCNGCQTVYFPQTVFCCNPECRSKQVVRILLPPCGMLHSFTIQRYRPPPLFRMDDWSPYAIGLIDLGDGLHVMAMLSGSGLDEIRIGMVLRLVLEPLYTDTERGPVLTYKFAPDHEA